MPLRSDSQMLLAWLRLRADEEFRVDMLRHSIADYRVSDLGGPSLEHAVSNAWGMAVRILTTQ